MNKLVHYKISCTSGVTYLDLHISDILTALESSTLYSARNTTIEGEHMEHIHVGQPTRLNVTNKNYLNQNIYFILSKPNTAAWSIVSRN